MLFNSHLFIFGFLPLTLLGYFYFCKYSGNIAISWLAAMSLVFYGWWQPAHLIILLGSILSNYLIARQIKRRPSAGKIILAGAVALNILLLCYYKYTNFILVNLGFDSPQIDLPLGISFFTFTQIAFLVDVYRKQADTYDFTNYLLFVTYFPHLIAGPILHHKEMMPQFAVLQNRRLSPATLATGLALFAIGLVKKVSLADHMALSADAVFSAPSHGLVLSMGEAWIGALSYTFQIYFDFSGYSDMAVGLSLLFGVTLPLNFASPYKATSIIDFWRRWHMTLSRFLRDYLYFPLGGNRRGPALRYINLMITMVLGGLWHGAAWTFVIWGALHGFYLLINHAWRETIKSRNTSKIWRSLSWVLTFLAVIIAWVPFRAADWATAQTMLTAMLGGHGLALPEAWATKFPQLPHLAFLHFEGALPNDLFFDYRVVLRWLAVLLLIVLITPNSQEIVLNDQRQWLWLRWRPTPLWGAAIGTMLAIGVLLISGNSPFLYFRF